uniref:Uncharacterized protein n=1 Tax=Leptobrachium leishanense TaxID=445787 RepID=A0A8C5MI20_9ANUR
MSFQTMLCDRKAIAKELIKRAEELSRSRARGVEGGANGDLRVPLLKLQPHTLTSHPAEILEDVDSNLHVFGYDDQFGEKQTLVVDVVANTGHTWVKAIGRKAEALHKIWLGWGQYGDKSIIKQAEDYVEASRQQPVQYSSPHIIFEKEVVSSPMAEKLKEMCISVRGDIVAVNTLQEDLLEDNFASGSESDEDSSDELQHVGRVDRENIVASVAFPTEIKDEVCNRVNLDITTLITYVSSQSWWVSPGFQAAGLNRATSTRKGREGAAFSILDTLDRQGEQNRAASLLQRVTVVPDQPSERALKLAISSKINQRSITIFGTGDTLKAITMTANSSFVKAAGKQVVKFSVFIYQPRALRANRFHSTKGILAVTFILFIAF